MTSRRCTAVAAFLAMCVLAAGCGEKRKEQAVPPSAVGVNLVTNPSFEEWDGAQPVGWKLEHFDGAGTKENMCGKSIDEKKSGDFAYSMRGVYNVERWMVLTQRHPVTPGYRLWFAAEMRGKDLQKSRGAGNPREHLRAILR